MNQSFFERFPGSLPGGCFVYRTTEDEEVCFADRNVISLFGCETLEEFRDLTGGSFKGMVHPEDLDRVEREIRAQTFERGERHDYVYYRICTKSGEIRYVEDFGHLVYDKGGDSYFYVYIGELRKSEYEEIDPGDWEKRVGHFHRMKRNSLTGLVYETDFYSACELNLSDIRTNWLMVAIDLKHFKLFNEWYGREGGDRVLADVGREIGLIAETHDGVAGYFGGDDFALLVPADLFDTDELLERIHNIVLRHGASVGFLPAIGASYSYGNTSAYSLYDQASLACQEAKNDNFACVKFFSQAMVRRTEEDYKLISDFKSALENGEITFFLQPQCRSVNGQIVGAEALTRWIKPDGRFVPPISFISTLERYSFIPDLDKFIWEEVSRWIRKCMDTGLPVIPVSVNISPVDIFTMDVPAFFAQLLEKYQIPRESIKIEITESAYGEGSEKVRSTVQEFRNMGFVVLMDDFGSGFSSLNMLRELNVDIIKLDAYFLRMEKNNERKGMHIIESVVNMAKTMAIPVIVEGVETKEQCGYLMGLGIQYIQGYYFYKPMSTSDFEKLIADEGRVDLRGFLFKANEEFRIREFLNDTVYTDSMLNNIIGPAAIYALHGEDIDIIRFNQQFYQAVNTPDFSQRLLSIQKTMPEHEAQRLFRTLKSAFDDRLNGASSVFTFSKMDGSSARFLIHFYFLNEDGEQRRFYGAARDVTEITNLHRHMELLSRFTSRTVMFLLYRQGRYSFDVTAHGLESCMGLTKQQLEEELNTEKFYKRLVPHGESVLWKIAQKCAESRENATAEFSMAGKDGVKLDLIVDADYVDDDQGDVKCILSMRRKNGRATARLSDADIGKPDKQYA